MLSMRGGRSNPLSFVSRLHAAAANRLRPEGEEPATEGYDFAARFTTLLALACLFVPFFMFEFLATGNATAAAALAVTGAAMAVSPCVYKWTGSEALARDLFLGGLFVFLLWEASYFDTIYSPGTVWFCAIPVVAVLLGSLRAAVIWLTAGIAGIAGTWLLAGHARTADLLSSPEYTLLYAVSVGGMVFAIFLFVVIVDAGRAETNARLVAANAINRELAERDELTGLFNRRALQRKMDSMMTGGDRGMAIILGDLDGFKDVNDTYGHHIGDRLLQQIADELRTISDRSGGIAARLGGDEFAIVVPGHDSGQKADAIAREMLKLVATPIDMSGRTAIVGMSLGLAAADGTVNTAELMRRADVAMYVAKSLGRMKICHYESAMDQSRARRRALAAMLQRALAASAIEVHYQPIVSAKTRTVTGVEALARWTAETGETISPDEFIPIAEEAGLIDRLGLFVLEQACRDAADWPGIDVAVNLSPVQFRSPTLVDDILEVLRRTGMEPSRLELEVTEGYLIEHRERAKPIISALRANGVRIALDDFGSGYSSIAYLRQYEFDRLKVDRSLAKNIVEDEASQGIIQATVILARSLSLQLTAEGVDSEETAQLLRLAGCDNLQGYLFGKPQPRNAIARLITSGERLATSA